MLKKHISIMLLTLFLCVSIQAQSTTFTYQGQLNDGMAVANGTYQMEFKLFDALSAGMQIGSTITDNSVTVTGGIFTVNLDFGSTAFSTGANRWLEISVRKAADPPGFTLLTPRQQITSSPYSLRTLSAMSADGLSSLCVGCVDNAKINTVAGTKVTGTVANATTAVNVSGTVAVANGGTGATTAPNARTNLGLGTLATQSPTGTANNTTFLRGDNVWATPSGGGGGLFFVFKANRGTSSTATIRYYYPVGLANTNTLPQDAAYHMPTSCTLGSFSVFADTNTFVARTFTVFKGSSPFTMAATTISCVPSTATQTCSSANTVALTTGEFFTVQDDAALSSSQPTVNFHFRLSCN